MLQGVRLPVVMIRALIISLLTAGPGWSVVWSDGRLVDTRDFLRRMDAADFFRQLASQNPNALRRVEGKFV